MKKYMVIFVAIGIAALLYQQLTICSLQQEIGYSYERDIQIATNKINETLQLLASTSIDDEMLLMDFTETINVSLTLSRLPNSAMQQLAEQLKVSGEQLHPTYFEKTTPEALSTQFQEILTQLTSLQQSFESDPHIWYKQINSDSQTVNQLKGGI